MKVIKLSISGLLLIKPDLFQDERGFFLETYNLYCYQDILGDQIKFVQDNMSYSRYGTIRGLHFQKEPFAQAKLIRCTEGKIKDVVVDIRKNSPTFGKHIDVELNEDEQYQLFIPRGFAHGFSVLSQYAIVEYKCDAYYNKASDAGIRFDDPELNIDWNIPNESVIISDKDKNYPFLSELKRGDNNDTSI